MLKIGEKDYDLNSLCNFNFTFDFNILKDVLMKLATSNKSLEKKVHKLENSNKEKNKRLSILENKLNIMYIPDKNSFSDSEESIDSNLKLSEIKAIQEKKEELDNEKKEDIKVVKSEEIKDNNNEEKIDDDNKEKKEDKKDDKKDDKNEVKIREDKKEEKKVIKEERNQKIKIVSFKGGKAVEEPEIEIEKEKENNEDDENQMKTRQSFFIKKSLKELESKKSINSQSTQVTHETIKALLKLIRENSEKINKIEKNISKKLNRSINDLEKNYDELNYENNKEHEAMKQRTKELNDKLYDYSDKIDNLIVKTAPLDNLSFFRDTGKGDINATKAMIQITEEKLYRKILILEKKNNEMNAENEGFKKKLEEIEKLMNQIKIDLPNQEHMINEENIKEIKNLIDEKYNDILKITNELSEKLKNGELIENKFNELLKKIKTEQLFKPPQIEKKIIIPKRKSIKSEITDDIGDNASEIKEYIKALNKKLNDIDTNYQSLFDNSDQEFIKINQKFEEMNLILEKKITKLDLKKLENKDIELFDQLRYIQDKFSEINETIKRLSENNPYLVKKLESLNQEIFELKKREVKEIKPKVIKPSIDLSKYIEENKLKEILKPLNKNFEKLFLEKDLLLKKINEINDNIQIYETKERVINLEEEINEKINELTNNINKKYLDKGEINKYFKSIELKFKSIESLQGHHSKDSENWILAKKPVGCFNCASCEANLKNMSPSNDYSYWNRYPPSERQYHMGQGFSKLLQKINNDNPQNALERKDYLSEIELNSSRLINNISKIKGKKGHFYYKVNDKENMKEEIVENSFRSSKKYKLPVVNNKKKKIENIPLTDEENEENKENNNNSMIEIITNSPVITKIKKKKLNEDLISTNLNQKSLIDEDSNNQINSSSAKYITKLERNKSMPLYENI